MGTITIRNLDDETIDRIKAAAKAKGSSMEQEVRDLIEARYAHRSEVIARIRQRRETTRKASGEEINRWVSEGR